MKQRWYFYPVRLLFLPVFLPLIILMALGHLAESVGDFLMKIVDSWTTYDPNKGKTDGIVKIGHREPDRSDHDGTTE